MRGWRGWRACAGGVSVTGGVLALNVECLLLNQKWKNILIDLNSDLKEEPDLDSRCYFTLFELVMPGDREYL